MRTTITILAVLMLSLAVGCPGRSFRAATDSGKVQAEAASLDSGSGAKGAADAAAPGSLAADPPQPPEKPVPPEGIMRLDESANGTTVTLMQGQRIELSLSANPTTGYSWNLARENNGMPYQLDQTVLKLVGNDFRQHDFAPPALPDQPTPPDPPVPPSPDEPKPGDPPVDPPQPGSPPNSPPDGPPGDGSPGDPDQPVIGSGGVEVWTFETPGAGSTELRMEYRRSWEKDVNAASTFTLTVIVEPVPEHEPEKPEPTPESPTGA